MKDESARHTFILHPSSFILLLVLSCAKPAPSRDEVRRVITLAPNVTEITYAIGCGGKIVGTDDFSDVPAAAARVAKVGGVSPDVEKIVALRPDLVIASASAAHPNLRRALASAQVRLLVVRTERLTDIAEAMTAIGRATGCDARAAVASFNGAIERQRRTRMRAPRVLFAVWTDPLYVAGRATFIDDLYRLTGAQNAADVSSWPQYSLESLVAHPPDVLLYPNRSVTHQAVAALLGRGHLSCEAIAVDENVFTRPGPRLVQAAAALNAILDRWEQTR